VASVAGTTVTFEEEDGVPTIRIVGRLDAAGVAAVWKSSLLLVAGHRAGRLGVDASGVDYCDGAGVGLFLEILVRSRAAGGQPEIRGLREEIRKLLDQFDPKEFASPEERPAGRRRIVEEIGRTALGMGRDLYEQIAFSGEIFLLLLRSFVHPRGIRGKDLLLSMERIGVDAFPIVALIGFLLGLILGYQSANALALFGAQIYTANLVGLSVLRELGPLMAAIILAGRTGSSIAAEIGTMAVSEEINALTTMGVNPTAFLGVPRVLATVAMIPLLTVFMDLFALVGGGAVFMSIGFPLRVYFSQTVGAVSLADFLGGVGKSVVFGVLVAGIGCLRGLQTGQGASAVGISATRAVVSGIVLIIVADGLLGILFHYLGI